MFDNCYNGKTVLVTGHTGFKGSWLTAWLMRMGARVVGFSDMVPTQPALFDLLELSGQIVDIRADVRDLDAVRRAILEHRPDFVFHLAAQPLVSVAYADPVSTYTTNIVGTLAVLDALRSVEWPCVAVMITSDKCYDNVEWTWGYRETDAVGGKDVYSGSKGAAELVIKSMFHSFLTPEKSSVRIGVGRAGNVIGGGDWAKDRIVVDAIKSWQTLTPVTIRSPNATRPWQHVLEPLSGYLALGQSLAENRTPSGEAYNFGPSGEQNRSVAELLDALYANWGKEQSFAPYTVQGQSMQEAGLLKLNCDKAMHALKWTPTLAFEETAELTAQWYHGVIVGRADPVALTSEHLDRYLALANERNKIWMT
ncbi:CDP-glucose 4,6-dehydratase [Devosia sp. J2-20]|uniref:CDP-glucose 4,6-dehydratase n=1 Tax=Devosia sp. J2-20 TaxID=3026161 RepID=UPI00249C87C7|nr:CDP-glucose 4,6-dehydratase [Devosia sp. J2-20]WDR00472.1 CDP-glucose 4,6-dehydratase [Devosia sp. J2-20]